jgi:hypothetical protein
MASKMLKVAISMAGDIFSLISNKPNWKFWNTIDYRTVQFPSGKKQRTQSQTPCGRDR